MKKLQAITLSASILLILSCSENVSAPTSNPDDWDIPSSMIYKGCAGRDCIPSLQNVTFIDPSEADYINPNDLVLVAVVNFQAVAFPYKVLNWHEIVNLTIAGVPVTVSYCPLTSSGYAFNPSLIEENTTFGVSGLLYHNNLIMYDRVTESHYSQMLMRAVQGSKRGASLTPHFSFETNWQSFKELFPGGKTISDNTGFSRDYNEYPYDDYWTNDDFIIFPQDINDTRLDTKDRVHGIVADDGSAKAYRLSTAQISGSRIINDIVGNTPVLVIQFNGGVNNRDVSYVTSFKREVNGETLDFFISDSTVFPPVLTDEQTGSEWSFNGEAIGGPLLGTQLPAVWAYNAFWFAWTAFYPDTDL